MPLLIDNIWMVLSGTAGFSFLLGWLVRTGIMRQLQRTFAVEREIAKADLDQARAEIDALYLAQRKAEIKLEEAVLKAETADAALAEREAQLQKASEVLAHAKLGRADRHTEDTAHDPEGALALIWQNRYLEARIRTLESASVDDADAREAVRVARAKLQWQIEYLRQRVRVLEENAVSTAAQLIPDSAKVSVLEQEKDEEIHEVSAASANTDDAALDMGEVEQELARLRWRTRFLEGRLAYLSANGEACEPESETRLATEPDEVETSADLGEIDKAVEDILASAERTPPRYMEERVVVTLKSAKANEQPVEMCPPVIDPPEDGGDDLLAIEGIGPRIRDTLNEIGIWTYRQVASWQPAHARWVNHRLGFADRVETERWVEQASVLAIGGGHA